MADEIIRIAPGHNVTIPSSAFQEASLRDGAEIHVRAQGPGRIVIECVDYDDDTTDLAIGGAYGMNGFGAPMPGR